MTINVQAVWTPAKTVLGWALNRFLLLYEAIGEARKQREILEAEVLRRHAGSRPNDAAVFKRHISKIKES
jgi:hypothetical protein